MTRRWSLARPRGDSQVLSGAPDEEQSLGAQYDFPEHQRGDKDEEYRESALQGAL